MGLVAHDREAARQAFEAALALSPSCALTYILGSVVVGLWRRCRPRHRMGRERTPFEPVRPDELRPVVLDYSRPNPARRLQGRGGGGAQDLPGKSVLEFHAYAAGGNASQAWATGCGQVRRQRVLELQPGFTISRMCATFDINPSLAEPLREALSAAGLPE